MKKRFMNRREMLVLGLPLLLLGIGAVFLSAREKKRIERERGPLRTVITDVKVEEVTPFEAWQGFDRKIIIDTDSRGQLKDKSKRERTISLEYGKTYLEGQIKGKTVVMEKGDKVGAGALETDRARGSWRANVWGSGQPRSRMIFLVNTQKFRSGSVHIKGSFNSRIDYRDDSKSPFPIMELPPATHFDINVRKADNGVVQNIDKTTPSIVSQRKITFSPKSEHVGYFDGQGETWLEVILKPPIEWKKDFRVYPRGYAETGIFNLEGKKVFPQRERFSAIQTNKTEWHRDGLIELSWNCSVLDIPLSEGPLVYRTWYSVDGMWPVKIEIPLRKKGEYGPSRLLKLEKVTVDTGWVKAHVRYLGTNSLSTKDTYMRNQSELHLLETGKIHLICNWSQHLTGPNGKEYWFENAVNFQHAREISPKLYEIVYSTNALDALKTAEKMKFSAQVGIEGDGFIPIEATISKSKQ